MPPVEGVSEDKMGYHTVGHLDGLAVESDDTGVLNGSTGSTATTTKQNAKSSQNTIAPRLPTTSEYQVLFSTYRSLSHN